MESEFERDLKKHLSQNWDKIKADVAPSPNMIQDQILDEILLSVKDMDVQEFIKLHRKNPITKSILASMANDGIPKFIEWVNNVEVRKRFLSFLEINQNKPEEEDFLLEAFAKKNEELNSTQIESLANQPKPIEILQIHLSAATDYKNKGNTEYRKCNFEQARSQYFEGLNCCSNLVAQNSFDQIAVNQLVISLNLNLAACSIENGKWLDEGYGYCTKAIEILKQNPENLNSSSLINSYLKRAKILLKTNSFLESKKDLMEVLQRQPENSQALVLLNKINLKSKKHENLEKEKYSKIFQY